MRWNRCLIRRTLASSLAAERRQSLISGACAEVHIIPVLSDNYSYVLVDKDTGVAAAIDPGVSEPMISKIRSLRLGNNHLDFKYILATHRHDDHVGGVPALKEAFKDLIAVGPANEFISSVDRLMHHNSTFNIGMLNVRVIHTPCHTKGHVCYYITGHRGNGILFTGDTLFVGGCGRFFEGTAEDMLNNMDILSELDRDTLVYCGHEYAISNLKFLRSIDSARTEIPLTNVEDLISSGIPSVPSTIGEELNYNLFMRCRNPATQKRIKCDDPVEAMRLLRGLKNMF